MRYRTTMEKMIYEEGRKDERQKIFAALRELPIITDEHMAFLTRKIENEMSSHTAMEDIMSEEERKKEIFKELLKEQYKLRFENEFCEGFDDYSVQDITKLTDEQIVSSLREMEKQTRAAWLEIEPKVEAQINAILAKGGINIETYISRH